MADRDAVYAWAEQVVADHGKVNLIINNAGVALGATVESMSYEDFEWLMSINFWGVVYGTKAFLPHLKASGEGHVVNLSSVFGLISVPSQSAYNAAKFAVRGFTDTLRMELEIEGAPVSVTTIHPGGIKTNIAKNARIDPSLDDVTGDPEKARADFEQGLHHQPREGGPADPDGRATRPATRAHRPGRQDRRLCVTAARGLLPAHRGETRQGRRALKPDGGGTWRWRRRTGIGHPFAVRPMISVVEQPSLVETMIRLPGALLRLPSSALTARRDQRPGRTSGPPDGDARAGRGGRQQGWKRHRPGRSAWAAPFWASSRQSPRWTGRCPPSRTRRWRYAR